jgi:hypothetical protein
MGKDTTSQYEGMPHVLYWYILNSSHNMILYTIVQSNDIKGVIVILQPLLYTGRFVILHFIKLPSETFCQIIFKLSKVPQCFVVLGKCFFIELFDISPIVMHHPELAK